MKFCKKRCVFKQHSPYLSRVMKEVGYLLLIPTGKDGKLSEGISINQCLDDVRDSLSGSLERIHLLTKKDLRNIGNSEGILQKERLHANDAVSIGLWVEEDKARSNSSVLFYKPQGTPHPGLRDEDIVLVIMTPPQKEIYSKFADKKICIDSTHGTNAYDFQLTSIVVVDEFGSGFPAAFCFSNRVDQTTMKIFFECVGKRTSKISTKVFMSDDAPALYNAWKDVNGVAERQLLCTWHVDKNWRNALSKISDKEKKVSVYKFARTLMEELNPSTFNKLMASFLKELYDDPDTKEFGTYFTKTYANRPQLWSFCHRTGAGINTNMYLESMHRVLKHVYMEGKSCKRLDKSVSHLLKMVRDRIFSRLIQLVKGGNSAKINLIHNRHKRSLKIDTADIEIVDDTCWKVKSSANSDVYSVKKLSCDCASCLLRCYYCKVCIHEFSCTCVDFQIHVNICKHIHAVNSLKREERVLILPQEKDIIQEAESSDLLLSTPENTNVQLKKKFELAMEMMKNQNYGGEVELKVNKLMDNVLHLLSCEGTPKAKSEPQNKRIILQPRYRSTKKKRIDSKSLCKPTAAYKNSVKCSVIENTEIQVVHDSFDHCYIK